VTLFLSGDGGWRDLDRDVAGEMAKIGYPVVGIDTLRYYWQHKSPEQSALDLTELMQHYRQKWGTKRFILTGYSFGADVLPAIYNRLPDTEQQRVDAIILLAFARTGSFEIEVEGWLGNAGKEAATGPEMAKLPAAKVVCIYGAEEDRRKRLHRQDCRGRSGETAWRPPLRRELPGAGQALVDIIKNARQGRAGQSDAEAKASISVGLFQGLILCGSEQGIRARFIAKKPPPQGTGAFDSGLHLDLRPQLDHPVQRQIEEAQVAVGVLQHERKQRLAPAGHAFEFRGDHRLAAEEVGGAHRAEVQLIQMAQLQRLRHVRLVGETEVQDHPEEASP
jgi:pimeloyl-ACP methyl ester carboxylesterase